MYAIDARDVHKTYGDVTALDGLSLTVEQGATFGLLGSNGAGKTTLFKLLVGLDRPDSGDLSVVGQSPANGTAVRERVGYLPEHAGFPGSLTGREILRFHARMRDVPSARRDRRVERVLRTVGLGDAADRAVSGYSNGMNRRLGLGTMLVANPAVLLLDEPTAGLDPHGIETFHDVVERIASETDITVVFSSHALAEVERLCDSVAVVHGGRVVRQGPVTALERDVAAHVTVTLRYESPSTATSVAETLRTSGDVTSVTARRGTLELECPRTSAYDVLATVQNRAEPASFEVHEPGLSRVFSEAVDEAGDAAADATNAASSGRDGRQPAATSESNQASAGGDAG